MAVYKFTNFDPFFLALERQYKKQDVPGNICHYIFEMGEEVSEEDLRSALNKNKNAQIIQRLRHHKKYFQSPFWQESDEITPVQIHQFQSDSWVPDSILHSMELSEPPYFSFSILTSAKNKQHILFSWNHLLMDGYGAIHFLIDLFGTKNAKEGLFHSFTPEPINFKTFWQAAKAKIFIDKTSLPPVSGVYSPQSSSISTQQIKLISFSPEETLAIDDNALKAGAKFGRSAFYLACTGRAVRSVLLKRNKTIKNFWIPVPKDMRKKGAHGPIIGNKLAFIFYRIKNQQMSTIADFVGELNAQMMNQIKIKMPQAYGSLMAYMKWLPLWLYYWFIRRKNGNTISTFLFTVAPDHPEELQKIAGKKVVNAFNLPANPPSPGLTFAYMKVNQALQLMVMYFPKVMSEQEFEMMAEHLKAELLSGKEAS